LVEVAATRARDDRLDLVLADSDGDGDRTIELDLLAFSIEEA
jgi:hypothetical protein